jgi:predicted RNase H-like nuclease (RuvC/YqgF family)
VDKIADYEDELRQLKAQAEKRGPPTPPATAEPPPPASFQSRFGASIFGSRRPSPAQSTASEPVVPTLDTQSARRESDLQAALAKEKEARQMAEGKVSQMNQEVEDLSVQLFQQANEMVASERKARAKLEERVETLEKRDTEKRKRLERLESALQRIERVRGLLAPPGG